MAKQSEKTRKRVKAMNAERVKRLAEMEKPNRKVKAKFVSNQVDTHAADDFPGK